jgi:TolB-like protein
MRTCTSLVWIALASRALFAGELKNVVLELQDIEKADEDDRKGWDPALVGMTLQPPVGCYDLRADAAANVIGHETSTGRLVTTKSNTAAVVATAVQKILVANGVKTSPTGRARLFLNLRDLFVEEGNTYVARARIDYILLGPNGDTLHRASISDTRSKWGRSYKYDNYMEALTAAIHSSVWEFLRSRPQASLPAAPIATPPVVAPRKPSQPVAKEFIAVLPLQVNGMDPSLSFTLSDLLVNDLQAKGTYKVLERDQIDKVLREQGFQKTEACASSDCAAEIGKLLSVRKLVVGSIGKLGNSYMLNVRLVDVQSGEIVANSSKRVTGDLENSAGAMGAIVDELCP